MIKAILKKLIKKIPIAFTRNQRYDRQTSQVIRKVCRPDSNCIDVGAHKGEVLDEMLKHAPAGVHAAFEPIPDLFAGLEEKYAGNPHCRLYRVALSNRQGSASFNYVVSNPSYSGLIKRKYDRPHEEDRQITVATERLDDLLPEGQRVDLIKIDVEGGELLVLEGARKLLQREKPVVIFEHGLGASDYYGATPEQVHGLLSACGLQVSTMARWLKGKPAIGVADFRRLYQEHGDYYFIAYA